MAPQVSAHHAVTDRGVGLKPGRDEVKPMKHRFAIALPDALLQFAELGADDIVLVSMPGA